MNDRWLKGFRSLNWVLGVVILTGSVGIMALAQSSTLPSPGTASSPSEQSVRMPPLMPDDFSVLDAEATIYHNSRRPGGYR